MAVKPKKRRAKRVLRVVPPLEDDGAEAAPPERRKRTSHRVRSVDEQEKEQAATSRREAANRAVKVPTWLSSILERARERGVRRARVAEVKWPDKSRREIGEELVRASAFRAGLLGAATGTLALVTLPIGMPAGIAANLFVEAELLFALLALYQIDPDGDAGRLRLIALWAGAGFADAAKSAGLRMSAKAVGRAIAGTLPARIIAKLEPRLLRAILKRFGMGFIPRLFKLWPILGAPISFALDRAALRTLGKASLKTLESLQPET